MSSRSARGAAAPAPRAPSPTRLALHPRRIPRSGCCASSFPFPAGARLQHRAPLTQPAAAAADPHLTHFPAGAGGVEKVSRDRSLRRHLRPGVRSRDGTSALRPWSRPRGERSQRPASAASPPGTRSEPAPGARARGLRAGGGHAPPARARLGGGASAALGRGRASVWVPVEPRPLRPGGLGSPAGLGVRKGQVKLVPCGRLPHANGGRQRCVSTLQVFSGLAGHSARRDYKVKNAKNHPMNHSSTPRETRSSPE